MIIINYLYHYIYNKSSIHHQLSIALFYLNYNLPLQYHTLLLPLPTSIPILVNIFNSNSLYRYSSRITRTL